MWTAFVTIATGLPGNNLVRLLLQRGFHIPAMTRAPAKAARQFGHLPGLEIAAGDMENVAGFAPALAGCDVVFHTAAYFRESHSGGNHWEKLKQINVDATASLIGAAWEAGVRRFIHTSSTAVVNGPRDADRRDDETRSARCR